VTDLVGEAERIVRIDELAQELARVQRERNEAIEMADMLADVLAARGADDPGAMRAIEAYNEWPRSGFTVDPKKQWK
jgi:hypothetical protein